MRIGDGSGFNLRYLSIKNNPLKSIPKSINLPQIRSISLEENKLANLPEALSEQRWLEQLYLENNPWLSLPDSLKTTSAKVHLSLSDKKRLLDYDYKGERSKGAMAQDNEIYLAKNNSQLNSIMRDAIKNTVLEGFHNENIRYSLKAICINTTTADDYTRIGNTRFGGMPDLPVGHEYPYHIEVFLQQPVCHHEFIAQLNCAELAHCQDYLPRQGMLYFFVQEADSYTPSVLYYANGKNLTSATALNEMEFHSPYIREPYKPFTVEFAPMVALPEIVEDKELYNHELHHTEPVEPNMTNIFSDEFSRRLGRTGGYRKGRDFYYTDMNHSINDTKAGIGQSPTQRAALENNGSPEDWMILLRVHSDRQCGFQFYDAGELYYLIRKSDLAKADFSNVYAFADSA